LSHLPNYFTNKWSQHVCLDNSNCSKAIAIDGNHKIHRLVCRFDENELIIPETSPIKIGCIQTPLFGSYYCQSHIDNFIYLNFYGKRLRFTQDQIICKKGKIKLNGIIFHDSIEKDKKTFFLVSYNDKSPFFVSSNQVKSKNFIV